MTLCDCGTEKVIAYSQMKNGKAKSCGCLQRRKGKDSPNFKHGLSQNRETGQYKRYQRECFDRFKYKKLKVQKADGNFSDDLSGRALCIHAEHIQ